MKKIAILGDLDLEFLTHQELVAETERMQHSVAIDWIPTDATDAQSRAANADGLWVIPGTPYKNDDLVYAAIKQARTTNQPFLGSCGGFQYALVEFARNVAGIEHAQHGEVAPDAESQIVSALSCSLISEERSVQTVAGTQLSQICGNEPFVGFHFCNYGLSDQYKAVLSRSGLVFNAHAKDAGVEGFELPQHGFFIATLFQPQVGASAGHPQHPLIQAFISALNA